MRKARYLLVACVLLCPLAAGAQTADDEAVRVLYEGFFDAFRQSGAPGAVGYLRQSGSIDDRVLRELEARGRQMEQSGFFGRPDSFVVVNRTEVPGSRRYRAVYALTHHDSRPVAWRLRFYRRVTGVWIFADIQWEEKFVEDFLRLSELEFAAYRRLLRLEDKE